MAKKERKISDEFKFKIEFWDNDRVLYIMLAKHIYFTDNDNLLYVVEPHDNTPNFYLNISSPRVKRIIALDDTKIINLKDRIL